jgi:dUTP pyrophosphatase
MSMDTVVSTTSTKLKGPAKRGDVGINLPSSTMVTIPPLSFVKVPTDISVELEQGTWGLICPRSSTNISGRLLVLMGVVDTGYRGELFIFVHNLSNEPFVVSEGQSIAQLVVMPAMYPTVQWVYRLSDSERGTTGFGSSGL